MFKTVEGLQKGAAGSRNAKSGGMKEAADAAEQIRKWVSYIYDESTVCYKSDVMPNFCTSFVSDTVSGVNGDDAPFVNFIRGRF